MELPYLMGTYSHFHGEIVCRYTPCRYSCQRYGSLSAFH
nr:MAG TPA: hypothetical protein [Caudoviricetes sp.]